MSEPNAPRQHYPQNPPRPYDLADPKETLRLLRETAGYLRVCHNKHGTDWEGRRYAIEALGALARQMGA